MDFHRTRRNALLRFAKADEVDAYLVTDRANVRYLSGSRTATALVVGPKGGAVVGDPQAGGADDLTPVAGKPGMKAEQVIADAVHKVGAKAVAVEAAGCPVGLYHKLTAALPKVAVKAAPDRVEAVRMVKDPSELEELRRAVKVAERAYVMFRAVMRESETEIDLGHLMDRFVRQAGAKAATAAVSLGETGGDPAHVPTDKQLGEVSKLLVVWGADVGYWGVLARAFRSPFEPQLLRKTKFERTGFPFDKVQAAVRQAHQAAVAKVRPGVPAAEVAAAAFAVLDAAGYAGYAATEVGHGLGLQPHEGPFLAGSADTELAAGMVLAVAPEVRIPDWGGVKYGTCLMVTRDGATDLTSGPVEFRD